MDNWIKENRIRVYSVDIDNNDVNLINWERLYELGFVHDSPLTHEYWYLDKLDPQTYSEYRVDNTICNPHYIVKAKEKSKIIDIIDSNGFELPTEIREKTALEIIEYFGGKDEIKIITSGLIHEETLDEKEIEIYKTIFGGEPQKDCIKDYYEAKYVDDCRLIKLI